MDIIVVEGTHDAIRIQSIYPDCPCVVTNGSQISKKTLEYIKELSKNNTIILFTDPDSAGERIRSKILEVVPDVKQAFLRKKDCISKNKKKVGIEHASREAIVDALSHISITPNQNPTITTEDLYRYGLLGNTNSAKLRQQVSDWYNIGNPNGKTFLKRLNLMGITVEQLEETICKIREKS